MSTPTEHPEPTPTDPAPATEPPPPAASSAPARKEKAKVSPARNAIATVLLIVLVIIGALELTALFRFNSAENRLGEALEANEEELLPRSTVEELLGKQPDGPLEQADFTTRRATYTWNGAIRSHVLRAYYANGDDPGLIRYEIGSAEAEVPVN